MLELSLGLNKVKKRDGLKITKINCQTTYVNSGSPDNNFSDDSENYTLVSNDYVHSQHTFIKFDLSILSQINTLVSSALFVTRVLAPFGEPILNIGVVDESWVLEQITWNNKPELNFMEIASSDLKDGLNSFNITDYIEDVKNGTLPNHGLFTFFPAGVIERGYGIYSHNVINEDDRPYIEIFYK